MSRQKKNKPPAATRAGKAKGADTAKEKGTAEDKAAAKGKTAAKDKATVQRKDRAAAKADTKPKSEKAAKRDAERAKAERRKLLKRTGRNFLVVVAAGVVVLGVTAWRNRDQDPVSVLGVAYEQAREQAVACGAAAPDPAERMQFEAPEDLGLSGTVIATIVTSCGDIQVLLDADQAPESVNSFVFLAERGFYDGTVVYSVRPGLAIEAGDQTAVGDQGPGYRIIDEPPPDDFEFERGTVALAAGGGPNRSDSRFMIVVEDGVPLTDLNVIGSVTAGDAVIDEITSIELGTQITGARTRPLETIYIESITIER